MDPARLTPASVRFLNFSTVPCHNGCMISKCWLTKVNPTGVPHALLHELASLHGSCKCDII